MRSKGVPRQQLRYIQCLSEVKTRLFTKDTFTLEHASTNLIRNELLRETKKSTSSKNDA